MNEVSRIRSFVGVLYVLYWADTAHTADSTALMMCTEWLEKYTARSLS